VAEEPLPAAFLDGVRRFNGGDFFEAHEAFEALLDEVEGDARWDLLLALVQIAVGYHKCAAGHPGAGRMLGLGAAKLDGFPPLAAGVDVAALRDRLRADLGRLEGGEEPAALVRADPPRIRLAPRRP
jgi:hypothetical protein